MKPSALALVLRHWPYGLELQTSAEGLLLRPRRKARANWARAFRRPGPVRDDLGDVRDLRSDFDAKEWVW